MTTMPTATEMIEANNQNRLKIAIQMVEMLDRSITTREDILKNLRKMDDQVTALLLEEGTCKHCGQPISRFGGGPWVHGDRDRSRGCRAATFEPGRYEGTSYNESLNKTWLAAPKS